MHRHSDVVARVQDEGGDYQKYDYRVKKERQQY